MDRDDLKVVGKAASEELREDAKSWMQTCHPVWLWAGVFSGWVLDLAMNLLLSLFNFIPVVGPMIIDTILGPINEMIVAIIPLLCLRELFRRWKNRKR